MKERDKQNMTYNQQLDGTEKIIIHEVDGELWVGGTNDVYVYYPFAENETLRIIEDRYPLNKETLPMLIEELKEMLDN